MFKALHRFSALPPEALDIRTPGGQANAFTYTTWRSQQRNRSDLVDVYEPIRSVSERRGDFTSYLVQCEQFGDVLFHAERDEKSFTVGTDDVLRAVMRHLSREDVPDQTLSDGRFMKRRYRQHNATTLRNSLNSVMYNFKHNSTTTTPTAFTLPTILDVVADGVEEEELTQQGWLVLQQHNGVSHALFFLDNSVMSVLQTRQPDREWGMWLSGTLSNVSGCHKAYRRFVSPAHTVSMLKTLMPHTSNSQNVDVAPTVGQDTFEANFARDALVRAVGELHSMATIITSLNAIDSIIETFHRRDAGKLTKYYGSDDVEPPSWYNFGPDTYDGLDGFCNAAYEAIVISDAPLQERAALATKLSTYLLEVRSTLKKTHFLIKLMGDEERLQIFNGFVAITNQQMSWAEFSKRYRGVELQ